MTKDYWFLVTIVASALVSVAYMVVFQVTPWDTYSQVKNRRAQVALHAAIGYRLLERGHYELAKTEFDRSLALDPLDQPAQHGRYLSDLFITLESPTWDAAIWSAVSEPLASLSRGADQDVTYIIEKYRGDVERKIANDAGAREHYERALALKPDYLDALYTFGWFHYFQNPPDTEQMVSVFRRMTEVERYDYRGFHGLGYALYMKAVKTDDPDTRRALVATATDQGLAALKLRIQQLNVTMDFGEIARSVRPDISIVFHQLGNKLLDDADTAGLPQNRLPLGVQLLMTGKYVSIDGDRQRRAWINYQLALDHLAVSRLGSDVEGSKDPRRHLAEYNRLLTIARELDGDGSVYPVYVDELAILDRLLQSEPQPR